MIEHQPFLSLGTRLKEFRQKSHESLAEVAGSVEIDINLLKNIESGTQQPSEDILLLLIAHFSIPENEATNLWEMATLNVEGIKNDLTPMSINLGITPMEVLVCKEDKTIWPVKAACIARLAVSSSLISPTIIIFGSCLKICLNPWAKP